MDDEDIAKKFREFRQKSVAFSIDEAAINLYRLAEEQARASARKEWITDQELIDMLGTQGYDGKWSSPEKTERTKDGGKNISGFILKMQNEFDRRGLAAKLKEKKED